MDVLIRRAACESPATGGDGPCQRGCWVQYNGKPKEVGVFARSVYQASLNDIDIEQDIKLASRVFDIWYAKARAQR